MTEYTPEPDELGTLDGPPLTTGFDQPEPPRPVNGNLLTAHELEQEWLALYRNSSEEVRAALKAAGNELTKPARARGKAA